MGQRAESALFNEIQHPQKRAFLLAYCECGRIPMAATAAKIHRSLPHYWFKDDPTFLAAFAEAKVFAVQALEDEAIRRAKDGVKRTIFYQGQPVGEETDYSDTLLIFLLKGALPEKYRERFEHSQKDGTAFTIEVVYTHRPQLLP